jgi:outer membrane protein TolC
MVTRRTRHEYSLSIYSHMAALTAFLMCGALLSAQDPGTAASHESSLVRADQGRHLTLDYAQQVASQPDTLLAKLGQLEVDTARQLRLATRADYFPQIATVFYTAHFNKFLGPEFVLRPRALGALGALGAPTIGFPLFGQDQNFIAVTATQPITPLFKVREAVAIARADENIARAKAGMAVATNASAVEKNYFDLLLAQKEAALAEARVRNARAGQGAGTTLVTLSVEQSGVGTVDADYALREASSKVGTLAASLNELLGWPADTRLELEPPAPLAETLSLQQVVAQALKANADVIEAEQNVRKAEAASNLSKLDYVPDIAVTGGYVFQDDVIPALPEDFTYIAVIGTYNIFDFGKREYSMKARSNQLRMARTALELTKAKVAASARASYMELEQARARSEHARGTGAAAIRDAKYATDGADVRSAQTQLEELRLDYEHRQAYARLKALMGQ